MSLPPPGMAWAERRRAAIAFTTLAPFVVAGLTSPPLVAAGSWLDLGLRALAWGLFFSGAALRLWATLYIGGYKGSSLITDGPYSLTRNPLYLGSFLLACSAVTFLQSATLAVGLALAACVYLAVTLPSEGRRLREHHGPAFAAYQRSTPAWWPRRWPPHTRPEIEVDLRCLAIEGRRALRWLLIPVLALLIVQSRSADWWPLWFQLP